MIGTQLLFIRDLILRLKSLKPNSGSESRKVKKSESKTSSMGDAMKKQKYQDNTYQRRNVSW